MEGKLEINVMGTQKILKDIFSNLLGLNRNLVSDDFEKSLIDEGLNQLSQKARSLTGIFRKK